MCDKDLLVGYLYDDLAPGERRTMDAHLVTCEDCRTELTDLPWVGHKVRKWEPEPLRWLGLNAAVRVVGLADAEERVTRRPSLIARAMGPILGE